jgi:predicted TIM-barrel fold metal-dependent hydrolase
MLAQMLDAGVDHTVLQTGWGYGMMNDYNAFAQNQYPDKFTAMLQVDEPRAYTQENLKEFDRAHKALGLRAVYFALDGYARYGFDISFDDPRMEAFWSKIDAAKLPVFFEATAIPDYKEENYLAIMRSLSTLMGRYKNIRWVLVMGPPVGFFGQSGKWQFPDDVMKAYKHENMLIEIMFPITWGGKWDYPYPEAQALIEDMRDKFGAAKLIWGSDMPNVERFCTYKQSLDYVKRYCSFLKASEKDAILGGNVDKLLEISKRAAAPQSQAAK